MRGSSAADHLPDSRVGTTVVKLLTARVNTYSTGSKPSCVGMVLVKALELSLKYEASTASWPSCVGTDPVSELDCRFASSCSSDSRPNWWRGMGHAKIRKRVTEGVQRSVRCVMPK